MEHAKPALGEGPVDGGPELLLREPEPPTARPFPENLGPDQPFELFREGLLVETHRGDQHVEVELGADRARVR